MQLARARSAQDDRVKLLPFSPHAELNSRAGWESEGASSVPIRRAWLAWDTSHFCHFWPENLSRSDSAVLIIHFCFGSGEIFMDSDPEGCTASSGGAGVANTQCCTSSPLSPLTLFPSFSVASFPSLKYFQSVPLCGAEFDEGLVLQRRHEPRAS